MADRSTIELTQADAVIDLGRLALAFGRIDRTAVYHPGPGGPPESDTDHTVMLGWVACSLATRFFPGFLDVGLVAQFALVHDAPEVYAGDTPTLRIDAAGRRAKKTRENAACLRLEREFSGRLPWLPDLLAVYEQQELPEARFVRGVDKILPKVVHLLDGCRGLIEQGMDPTELAAVFDRQAADMAAYVDEFTALMDLRRELVDRTITARAGQHQLTAAPAGTPDTTPDSPPDTTAVTASDSDPASGRPTPARDAAAARRTPALALTRTD